MGFLDATAPAVNGLGTALFPDVPVPAMGGKIISFGAEAWRDFDTSRAPGSRAAELQMGYEGEDFALQMHSMDAKVPREWMQDAKQVVGLHEIISNCAAYLHARTLNGIGSLAGVENLTTEESVGQGW